jgi:hypothetical protein
MASKRKKKPLRKPARSALSSRSVRKKVAKKVPLAGSVQANKIEEDFLLHRRIDDLAAAYVSVLGELWIMKDRQAVLEQVLAQHNIPAAEAVEKFEPTGAFKAQLDAERQVWIRRMIGALFRKGLPTVS